MSMTFSSQPVLFANVSVGSWFQKSGTNGVYFKTDGWHARRANSSREVRVPAVTVCYVEAK